MPSINMIANRRAEKKRQALNIKRLIYAIGAEIACVIAVFSILYVKVVTLRGHISDLSSQGQKLQPKVDEIKKLEQETADLQPKVKTLDGAKADTLYWYTNICAITNSLPGKSWLTSMGLGGGGGAPGSVAGADPVVSIAGVALDEATVGEAMQLMNQSPTLDHVDLSLVQQQKTGNLETVSFQMSVHLKPETPPTVASPGGSTNA
jgi:Tfp pilus assembly protein PilN